MGVGLVVVTLDRIVALEPSDVVACEDVVVSKPVVDNIVVTHLRKPVVGVASLHNFLEGCNVIGEFSISSSRSDDSNQNRHVIWHFVSMLFAFFFFEYLQPTSAASSDRLPPLSFTDEGIWNEGAIKLSFGFCDLD